MASFGVMGLAAEQPTLLWTNPSPDSRFGELTLNVSRDDYPVIIVKYKSNYQAQPPTTGIEYTTVIDRLSSMQTGNSYGIVTQNTSGGGWWVRPITENNTSITFADKSTPAGVSGGNASNAWVSVLEVYGLTKPIM